MSEKIIKFAFGLVLMAVMYFLMWHWTGKYEMCKKYFIEDVNKCMRVF